VVREFWFDLSVTAGTNSAESRAHQHDNQPSLQAADDVKIGGDLMNARVKSSDAAAKPSLVDKMHREFSLVKKLSPQEDFNPDADELPTNGHHSYQLS